MPCGLRGKTPAGSPPSSPLVQRRLRSWASRSCWMRRSRALSSSGSAATRISSASRVSGTCFIGARPASRGGTMPLGDNASFASAISSRGLAGSRRRVRPALESDVDLLRLNRLKSPTVRNVAHDACPCRERSLRGARAVRESGGGAFVNTEGLVDQRTCGRVRGLASKVSPVQLTRCIRN